MTVTVPLEIEEDNEELERRETLLKNRRGRELASLIALEQIAQELKSIRTLLSMTYDDFEFERKRGKSR